MSFCDRVHSYGALLDIRKANKSSKFSPISSTARTTMASSNPFMTISWTTGGYSSTERIGLLVQSSSSSAATADAAEATDATEAATGGTKAGSDATACNSGHFCETNDCLDRRLIETCILTLAVHGKETDAEMFDKSFFSSFACKSKSFPFCLGDEARFFFPCSCCM